MLLKLEIVMSFRSEGKRTIRRDESCRLRRSRSHSAHFVSKIKIVRATVRNEVSDRYHVGMADLAIRDRRIDNQGSALGVTCELEIAKYVASAEIEMGGVASIADRQRPARAIAVFSICLDGLGKFDVFEVNRIRN